MSKQTSLAAILAEQRRAAAAVIAEPGRGVRLWLADWVAEELLIMSETKKTAGQVLYEAYEGVGEIDPIDHKALAGEGPEYPEKSIGNRAARAARAVIDWYESPYKAFFASVWAAREGGMDGGDIEDAAVECGLAERVQASEPCGEACACEMYGFPGECVRLIER